MLTWDLDQTCTDPTENRCRIFNNGKMVSILPARIFELSSGVQIGKHVSVFTDGVYLGLYFERQQLMSLSYETYSWKPIYQSHDILCKKFRINFTRSITICHRQATSQETCRWCLDNHCHKTTLKTLIQQPIIKNSQKILATSWLNEQKYVIKHWFSGNNLTTHRDQKKILTNHKKKKHYVLRVFHLGSICKAI